MALAEGPSQTGTVPLLSSHAIANAWLQKLGSQLDAHTTGGFLLQIVSPIRTARIVAITELKHCVRNYSAFYSRSECDLSPVDMSKVSLFL